MPSNLRRLPNGRIQARVMVHGRNLSLGTYETAEEAHAAVQRAKPPRLCPKCKRPLENQPAAEFREPAPLPLTVFEWGEMWMTLYPGERNDETARHNFQMTAAFVRSYAKTPMPEVTQMDAQAWAVRSPGSVRYLKLMWDRAVRAGVTPENPWANVEKKTRRKRPPVLLSVQDVDRLASCARRKGGYGAHLGDLVIFAAYTGLRLSEVADVQAGDVREDGRRLVVRGKRQAGEESPRVRVVAVFPPARRSLMRQLPDVGRVWHTRTGRPLTVDSVSYIFRALREDAQLHGATFHSLRRFHASWLADQGATSRDTAVQLGHFDAAGRPRTELVEGVYAHPAVEPALARLEAVAR